MNKETARKALEAANDVLRSLGVRYWIDCGTLLGAIREGKFMDHDLDVDLGCWDHERADEIAEAMVAAGFTPYRTFGSPEHGYEQRFKWFNVKLDIFYFYDEGETCWQGSWLNDHLIVSRFPKKIVAKTKTIEFKGLEVPVPIQAEAMLKARYGDWRTPVTKWDWARDPKCITEETHPDTKTELPDVTFLIKTFMRPHLAIRAVKSIRDTYQGCDILVVDDSNAPDTFEGQLEKYGARLLRLPYDVGLSAGRNAGIKEIRTPFTFVMDDDMLVSNVSNVPALVRLLDRADVACGAMLQNRRPLRWEGTYEFLEGDGLRLVPLVESYEHDAGTRFQAVDFALNILVARTEFLREHPWDETLKLHEHTDWFLGLKEAKARVVFSPDCLFGHEREIRPEYKRFRRRKEFRLRFYEKHGFKYHIGYSGHRDEWKPQDEDALEKLKAAG